MILNIQMSSSKLPVFKEVTNDEYVKFDTDDKYPMFLIRLLKESSKHGAIVRSKTTYVFGGGLKVDDNDAAAVEFKKKYTGLWRKKIYEYTAFGMFYIQCIPTRGGGWKFHHISYERMRINKNSTKFFYKKDWTDWREKKKCYPAFDPNAKVPSIFVYRDYTPDASVYGLPEYLAAINWIESDVEVSKHTLTNAKTGFSASKFINFYNGEPAEADKRSIETRFNDRFGGAGGKKIMLGFNNDPTKRPTIDDLGASDLTKEDFSQVDQLISTNLYAGHEVTNPALFGIPPSDHSLGGNAGAELRVSYELFKNTYVNGKRVTIEAIVNYFASLFGVTSEITFIDVEPVGYVFTEATMLKVAPRSWLLEKLGIDTNKYPDAPVESAPAPATPVGPAAQATQENLVNENLKNLTAKQMQHLNRIVRQVIKGSLTREAGSLLLKSSFGLTDDDVNVLLGIENEADTFGSDEDVAELFAAHGEARDNFEVYQPRLTTFKEVKEYSDIENKIIDIRKAKPKATAKSIANEIGVEEAVVKDYLDQISKGTAVLPKFEVRYSYEKRKDVTGPEILPTTRPFCRKMLSLNKLYTREDIQKISQYLGYDVMKRAGGFWNNDGKVEYHCRHEFYSQIVIKRKAK